MKKTRGKLRRSVSKNIRSSRVKKAKEKSLRAKEEALRLRAEMAFLAAGGVRGDFAREWPSVYLGDVRGARSHGAGSGD